MENASQPDSKRRSHYRRLLIKNGVRKSRPQEAPLTSCASGALSPLHDGATGAGAGHRDTSQRASAKCVVGVLVYNVLGVNWN